MFCAARHSRHNVRLHRLQSFNDDILNAMHYSLKVYANFFEVIFQLS